MAFAAFSNHCSLFPMSGSVIEAFKNELKDFPTCKGTIRFPVDKSLPDRSGEKAEKAEKAGEGANRAERKEETALMAVLAKSC